jgi:hypothetical protein
MKASAGAENDKAKVNHHEELITFDGVSKRQCEQLEYSNAHVMEHCSTNRVQWCLSCAQI